MKKKSSKILGGITGASLLLSGYPAENSALAMQNADVAVMDETGAVDISIREESDFEHIANVTGTFAFNQDHLTPPDEVFSLFGTVATALCAKPAFALEQGNPSTIEDWYVNVGGEIKKGYTVQMEQLIKSKSRTAIMKCACATGGAVANAKVVGVRLADVIEMAQYDKDVNTITVKGEDGYGIPMPLTYALEKEAMLVYQIGDKPLPPGQGGPLQLWMPETVAKYFSRRVMDIELTTQKDTPSIITANPSVRAQVNILNKMSDTVSVGDTITFEGYADDFDVPIKAVEFSMDDGKTWTSHVTDGVTADKWVYWKFSYKPEKAGSFKLLVRAVTAKNVISPLAASVSFNVREQNMINAIADSTHHK